MEDYYTSREVAAAAGLPYPTLMRWLQAGVVLRRGPGRRQPGGGLLWSERALHEARIAAGLRDYISRAEGPMYEIMQAVQALDALPREPALHLDALGRPHVVEYDPTSDDLRLYAPPEVRRTWAQRRMPRQRWLDQEEVERMGGQSQGARMPLREQGTLDLFA
jgi:hypothetical protein